MAVEVRTCAACATSVTSTRGGAVVTGGYSVLSTSSSSKSDNGWKGGDADALPAAAMRDSQKFTCGSILFGLILFIAGALPSSLPWIYVAFFAVCFPMRVVSFCRHRWGFFLIDFCYFANLAVCCYLMLDPVNLKLQTVVYALADGPLAGALAVWQCAWVFGSSSHYISVLIHLLPGLAMFSHRWAAGPKSPSEAASCLTSSYSMLRKGVPAAQALRCWDQPPLAPPVPPEACTLVWTLLMPLLFYAAWQLLYWVIVQVCCRRLILSRKYDTSYSTLARRASRADGALHRLVRRGSAARRVTMYGLVQAAFTLAALGMFQLLHGSFYAGFLWQVAKFVIPVWYGSRVQCEKVPQRAVHRALSLHDLDAVLRSQFAAAAFDKRA